MFEKKTEVSAVFTYTSKDGEEGFPGNLKCSITFSLTNNNELVIDYSATTDKTTVVNITNHNYFNLAGQGKRDILDHELLINAELFTPIDSGLIPTGELRPVSGTAMDFRVSTPIGDRIDYDIEDEDVDMQLVYGKGYDHNWVINRKKKGFQLEFAAQVVEPESGRIMEIFTTEPGLQFYAGNFLDSTLRGKGGRIYHHRYGFCLETQHFPDSPNQPKFPSVTLKPGEKYRHKTVFLFKADR